MITAIGTQGESLRMPFGNLMRVIKGPTTASGYQKAEVEGASQKSYFLVLFSYLPRSLFSLHSLHRQSLHLLYLCDCAFSGGRQVSAASPSMSYNFARSKPFHDINEPANLASIIYSSNWISYAKECELLGQFLYLN